MRILMLSQFYPPIIGGADIYVRSLSVELVSRGHDVAVVTLWHKGLEEFELDQGVRVYRVRSSMRRLPWFFSDEGRQYAPPFTDPEVMMTLRRIIVREKPEIVHAHNWLVYSFLPLKAWSGARLVMTLHDYSGICVKSTLLHQGTVCNGPGFTKCLSCATEQYGLVKGVPTVLANSVMSRMNHRLVDMFLTVSHAAAVGNDLLSNRKPFQVIPNFMTDNADLIQLNSNPYLRELPTGDFLLFVGAFSQQKGVDVLLQAYAGLTQAPPLVLIGFQTREWPFLSKNCPENVFVLKDWPRSAVMEAYRRSMFVLAPSVGPETFGMAVMEAMAEGCPVIASRIGGLSELVVDGITGLLTEPANPLALRQAIERLLTNSDLRKNMGRAAQGKAAEYQAHAIVPRIETVYEEVLQKKARQAVNQSKKLPDAN